MYKTTCAILGLLLHQSLLSTRSTNIMIKVLILCCSLTLPIIAQKLTYLPSNPRDTRQHSQHGKFLGGENAYSLGIPVYKSTTPPSLSKLFKPRPPELDNLVEEYQNVILKTPDSYIHGNEISDQNSQKLYPKSSSLSYQPQVKRYYGQSSTSSSNLNDRNHFVESTKYYPKIQYSNRHRTENLGYRTSEDVEEEPSSNYEFSYIVLQPEFGLNFGHQESKQGVTAKGVYHTLLPDGRTQYVEYEADNQGYKPRITYKDNFQNKYR